MKTIRRKYDDTSPAAGFAVGIHPHKGSDIHPCFNAGYHYFFFSAVEAECSREDINIHDRQMVWEQMRKRYDV